LVAQVHVRDEQHCQPGPSSYPRRLAPMYIDGDQLYDSATEVR